MLATHLFNISVWSAALVMSMLNNSNLASPQRGRSSTTPISPHIQVDSPNQKVLGTSKKGYGHACTFISLIKQWFEFHRRGTVLCQRINMLRLHEFINLGYPPELRILSDSLSDVLFLMTDAVQSMENIATQCKGLAKLEPDNHPMFNTWSALELSNRINELYNMFMKELEIKRLIKENIAHCRDENIMEVYTSAWEYNTLIDQSKLEFLLAELNFDISV